MSSHVTPAVTVLQELLTKETEEDTGIKIMKGTLAAPVKKHISDVDKVMDQR